MEIKCIASGSSGNSYIIKSSGKTFLIDMGIKVYDIIKALDFNLAQVSFALLDHQHGDHSKSVKGIMEAGIDVYMPQDTATFLGISGHRVKVVEPLKQFDVAGFQIVGFPLEHDVTNFGYLIYDKQSKEKLLFITDTFYCKYRFSKLNYIMVECNYSDEILEKNIKEGTLHPALRNRIKRSHFSLNNVIEFLKASDTSETREIMLLHLSSANSDEALFKKEVEQAIGIPTRVF